MRLEAVPIALIVTAISVTSAFAAQLSQAEIDAAIAVVAEIEEPGVGECLKLGGLTVRYDAEQLDLNNDGRNEVIVRTSPSEFGKGGTSCFGRVGSNIYVAIADENGVWKRNLGFDTSKLEYHQRGDGKFPDIELVGPGFCFPIWRFYKSEYGLWKACDDLDNHIFADTADWTNSGIPRDADEPGVEEITDLAPYSRETDLEGPEFWHNDSLMVADHERGLILYKKPKKSLANVVKPGDVVFRGKPWDLYDPLPGIRGTAYVFRKGCDPAPYAVYGARSCQEGLRGRSDNQSGRQC